MTYERIPNRKKVKPKYEYHKDANSTSLPPDFIEDQRRRSMRFVKKGDKNNG